MRLLLFISLLSACGHPATVATTGAAQESSGSGGRDSNPPLALLSPGAGHWAQGHSTTSSGGRDYSVYVPKGAASGAPLVVMLHGCEETPATFAAGTRMNALADAKHFYVLYPAQDTAANANGCWNWYDLDNQARSGEPALIAAMTQAVTAQYALDSSRVYVAGMSAGAAMAVTTAGCYPDIFAAVGVHSGLEFGAAPNAYAATWAMLWGGPSPEQQGSAAFACGAKPGLVVPAIVFQGAADPVVAPVNGAQVAQQLTAFNDLADDGIANGSAAHTVEMHAVPFLGHAWSGGDARYPYNSALGPDASTLMWQFFTHFSR